jgi:hypothetical protein
MLRRVSQLFTSDRIILPRISEILMSDTFILPNDSIILPRDKITLRKIRVTLRRDRSILTKVSDILRSDKFIIQRMIVSEQDASAANATRLALSDSRSDVAPSPFQRIVKSLCPDLIIPKSFYAISFYGY